MPPFLPQVLPQLNPQDVAINFAPAGAAIGGAIQAHRSANNLRSIGEAANTDVEGAATTRANELGLLGLARDSQKRDDTLKQQAQEQKLVMEKQRREQLGNMALMVQNEQDPDRKASMWQNLMKQSGASDVTPEEADPQIGPAMMIAEAGLAGEAITNRGRQEDRGLKREQFALTTKDKQANLEFKHKVLDSTIQYRQANIKLKEGILKIKQGLKGGYKSRKEKADVERSVRKEFIGITSTYRDVRDAADRVEASAQKPSAAGDLALIFNYMKILDPGSVVRESEFATASATGSARERALAFILKIRDGTRLSPKMRADFVNRSRRLFAKQEGQYKKTEASYRNIAKRLDLDVQGTIPDFTSASERLLDKGTEANTKTKSDPLSQEDIDDPALTIEKLQEPLLQKQQDGDSSSANSGGGPATSGVSSSGVKWRIVK